MQVRVSGVNFWLGVVTASHAVPLDSESPATLIGATVVDELAWGEVGLFGIFEDVPADGVVLFRVPDEMIEDFLLPEGSLPSQVPIDGGGGVLHPRRTLVLHRRRIGKSGQQVNMIGHDDKVAEFVANSIKVFEGHRHNLRQFRLSQFASSLTRIEEHLASAMEHLGELCTERRTRNLKSCPPLGAINPMLPKPLQLLELPLGKNISGNRIVGPHGDEHDCAGLGPMGTIPLPTFNFTLRIKWQPEHVQSRWTLRVQ